MQSSSVIGGDSGVMSRSSIQKQNLQRLPEESQNEIFNEDKDSDEDSEEEVQFLFKSEGKLNAKPFGNFYYVDNETAVNALPFSTISRSKGSKAKFRSNWLSYYICNVIK